MLKISSFFTVRQSSIFATRLANSGAPIIQVASFGTQIQSTDKETLFNQLIEEASQIKEYNYKSYFVRRAIEDKAKMDQFSVPELQERLEQMKRIRIVQNLYVNTQHVDMAKKQQ